MKRCKRISLQDIAAEANVSKTTVSLALKNHPRIPPATRERIRRIAEKLGYQPDPELAKLMATIKREPETDRGTIAFIRSGPTRKWEPMEAYFYQAITEGAKTYGYQVEPFSIYEPHQSPERVNATIWNRGIDGLVIPMIHPERYREGMRTLPIDWNKFSVVEIADTIQTPKLSGIRHNHFGGMLQTLSELEALGYTRIGLCMAAGVELRTHHRWTAAYLLWKAMRGWNDDLPMHIPEDAEPAPLLEWIDRHRVEAVVSPGVEIYHMLRDQKVDIPGQLAYATLHQWGEGSEQVTGINQNMKAQALIAIDMLVGMIRRKTKGAPQNPILATDPGYWHHGKTTRAPKRRHRVRPLDNEPIGFGLSDSSSA